MCGIAGIAQKAGEVEPALLTAMRDTMIHRGPDDADLWLSPDRTIALAHRRLSIIDLSVGGRQPMSDPSGAVRVVFNGEIYNFRALRDELQTCGHVFRTQSDTEVLLAAYNEWGTECPKKLNGMFSFCIHDSRSESLFMARDRAGEKPLYYCQMGSSFVFASELKALIRHPGVPKKIDSRALEFFLTYGYVPGELCILAGVRKLRPGNSLSLDIKSGATKVWSYWQLPPGKPLGAVSDEDLVHELEDLLKKSVSQQLIADVPVGILLSGGVDSSLVTAVASAVATKQVRTFTITFPGYDNYDEGPYAQIVAKHFGTLHTELVAEPSSVELLPGLAAQFDEPLGDSSMVPTFLVSKLIRKHAKVALGGDGGDELFGGYYHYSYLVRQSNLIGYLTPWFRSAISALGARMLQVGTRGRNYVTGLSGTLPERISRVNVLFDSQMRRRLLGELIGEGATNGSSPEAFKADLGKTSSTLPEMPMRVDFSTYLPDDILAKVDRASMLASLEVRAPLLDYRIIEFAFSKVPNRLRATPEERKILPRMLASRILPKSLDLGRKQGFSLPLPKWFRGPWGAYMQEVLRDAGGIFNRTVVDELVLGQRRGRVNTERLFALTMFELWRREYSITM